ncbi:MAG: hypothetical protein HYW47_04505 [Deltaproteobacteria bacterium]|nr:hypothetical protein [Deltaproteobacteria bacterium]
MKKAVNHILFLSLGILLLTACGADSTKITDGAEVIVNSNSNSIAKMSFHSAGSSSTQVAIQFVDLRQTGAVTGGAVASITAPNSAYIPVTLVFRTKRGIKVHQIYVPTQQLFIDSRYPGVSNNLNPVISVKPDEINANGIEIYVGKTLISHSVQRVN